MAYHMHRKDKEITDESELYQIIDRGKFLTLALAKENQPYLVSLNYGFDRENNCFLVHCAKRGKKIEFLQSNSHVWGQIVEDNGYLEGECDHAFTTLHFEGKFEFQEDIEIKRKALIMMIERFESDPEPIKKRNIKEKMLQNVMIGKIKIKKLFGKQSPAKKRN
ncbi:pyridoxamine 5'-phosphate oxidase family protein [Candidatus Lokiarchaeum ossiferum]|uniref:pyridoxamine 5'-phosphate oxidase family protein n=1 Tax=Candidatus Lokiarchaeum ossiferum TaxID=2951803 RepID=UPI00352D0519